MPLRHMPFFPKRPPTRSANQRGVVLLIALIVLVALTLAGVALIRSVDTTNLIAGNMSMHQSAIHAGERGTEQAITWLQSNNSATLYAAATGYSPARQDPARGESWNKFWDDTLKPLAVTGATDAAGNTVAYFIHRLCNGPGAPQTVNCSEPPVDAETRGHKAGEKSSPPPPQVYYRITTRIAGLRNTVAYLQTIVAQ